MAVPALTCSGRSAVHSCDFWEGDRDANSGTWRATGKCAQPAWDSGVLDRDPDFLAACVSILSSQRIPETIALDALCFHMQRLSEWVAHE